MHMSEINITEFIGNISQIAEQVGRNGEPVIISGNDSGDLVLMARADYESRCETAVFFGKLRNTLNERITEAAKTDRTVGHDTVLRKARDIIGEGYRKTRNTNV
jgi:PHD/YefM family antitoxin component YafN of YafNO toxin-antitoxin module